MAYTNANMAGMGALVSVILGFLVVFLIIFIAVYIYTALAVMAIAKKTNTPNPWLAWIPVANVYLWLRIAGLSGWWTFGLLVMFVPIIGGLLLAAGIVYVWWLISEKINRPGWWGILQIVPIVNLIMLGVMAWGNPQPQTAA